MKLMSMYQEGEVPEKYNYLRMRSVIDNLTPNKGAEMVRYARRRPDVLSLAQGEGSTPTPDFILKGAQKAMEEGKTFYGPVLGHDELRQELSNYYSRLYNLDLPTSRIFVTGSGTTAMHLALTALLDEGDEAVAIAPIWKNLLGAVELAEAQVKEVAMDEKDGRWSLDLDKLFDACTPKTKVILITSPSNPTGWVMKHDEMKAVMEFARDRDIWVIADEVYSRLTFDAERAPSFLEVAEPDDKLFTINSFSKAWAMTGWRLGWLIGPQISEPPIRDIAIYDNMGPPSFTQFAAIEALRHGEDFLKEQMDLWRGNRDFLYERFAESGRIIGEAPEATFYAFFRVEGEPDCIDLTRRLIDEQALGLAPGCAFGKTVCGYMRMCFAVDRPIMEDAWERLEKVIKAS